MYEEPAPLLYRTIKYDNMVQYIFIVGKFVVSSALLKQMLEQGQKVVHKLNPSDLNAADRMKVDPSIKLMNSKLIDHLQEIVPSSNGTVAYLKVMRNIYLAFTDELLSPLERIELIWFVLSE